MDLPHEEGETFLRANDKETVPISNGLVSVVEESNPANSLGFDVVATHQTTTGGTPQDDGSAPMEGYMSAMSDSEYVPAEAENMKKFHSSEDLDARSASPAETGETGSFHTPDILDTSSEMRDEPDFSVVIPQLEGQTPLVIDRTTHVEDKRGGTRQEERESEGEEDVTVVMEEEEHPPREFVVEQPKLLLADPAEPMPEKQPLPPSLTNTAQNDSRPHQRARSRGRPPVTETTPLISSSGAENSSDGSSCCTIL